MNLHYKHNTIGKYCWDCRMNLAVGTPGFPRPDNHSASGPKQDVKDVVWADGTHDDTDRCAICGHGTKCKYPVHGERYKIVSSTIAKNWDVANGAV